MGSRPLVCFAEASDRVPQPGLFRSAVSPKDEDMILLGVELIVFETQVFWTTREFFRAREISKMCVVETYFHSHAPLT